MPADSHMVSREGGEQHLVVEHEGEEYEATLRTVYYAEEDEERDEYVLPDLEEDEEYPAEVEEEVSRVNQTLADRGVDESASAADAQENAE